MSPPESNFNGTIILNDPEGLTTDGELSYIRPTSREALVDALTILSERKATPKKIVVIGGFTSFDFPQLHLEEQGTDLSTSARGLRSPHLVVDCSGMNRILDVDTLSLTVTVEAGITYWDLANQLRPKGLAVANLSAYPEVTVGVAPGRVHTGLAMAFTARIWPISSFP